MFRESEKTYNIDRHLVKLFGESPFFAEISRHVRKVCTEDLPTAGVTYDKFSGDFVMGYNPDFFAELTDQEVQGVIRHEYYHLVFLHVTNRRRTPHMRWNVATDLAINSIILDPASGGCSLPDSALVPGRPLKLGKGKEHKAAAKVSELIAKFPVMESSDFYFNRLSELAEELRGECPVHGDGAKGDKSKGSQPGDQEGDGGHEHGDGHGHDDSDDQCTCGGIGPMDSHDGWGEVPDDLRDEVEAKAKGLVEKAAKAADSRSNGWGSMPSNIRDEIRRMVAGTVDWKKVLRQFIGSITRGGRSTSIRRINRKYPMIHPGVKKGYEAKLAVAVDQSGSVSDEMLAEFFAELGQLTRKVSVTVIPFDYDVEPSKVFEWRKGTTPKLMRSKCGGTSFDPASEFVNRSENRGKWDGILFLTDGCAPAPGPSRIKRGWVLGKGCKLEFPTDELQVSMEPGSPTSGAWR